MNITEKTNQAFTSGLPNMDESEKFVMEVLMWEHRFDHKKTTQREIIETVGWKALHPDQKAQMDKGYWDSALRSVRQVIRDLRIDHHIPILSDAKGYWLGTTNEEAMDWLQNEEKRVRAQSAALWLTHKAMSIALDITPEFEPLDQH